MKKLITIVALILLALMVFAFSGCTAADVSFNRDGSGTVTLVIAKEEGVTQESIENYFAKVSEGVKRLSTDEKRFSLKRVKDEDDAFVVTLSFRRVQYTKGVGEYDYMKSTDFLLEFNKTTQVKKYSDGIYRSTSVINFDESKYDFKNISVPTRDKDLAFSPINYQTGEEMEVDDFISENGVLSNNKKGRMFSFVILDFPAIQSITFNFDGNIKVYGSKNVKEVTDNSITVLPVTAKVTRTYYEGDTLEPTVEEKEVNVFAGYVYFELGANKILIAILATVGIVLLTFIVLGIVKGWFRKAFKSRFARIVFSNYEIYLMMIPALVLLVLFAYLPMGGVVMAFKNYKIDDGIWGSEWASMGGFKHFIDLLTKPSADFGHLALNTFVLALLKFIFGFVCAILLAVLFSYLKNGLFKKTVQTISYFPYFISWVVVSSIAYLFLASATATSGEAAVADQGLLNKFIMFFGGKPIEWYSSPQYWRGILTFTSMWKTVGYSTIVYLAAITAINPSLYEAAEIDGAGRWKQLIHVTIPGLFPVIGIQVVFSLGNLVKDDFDQIYTMTNGSAALSDTTEVIGTIIYKSVGTVSAYSDAAAMGFMQGVVGLLIVLASNKFMKKLGVDGVF